jgi:aminoglycoside phosphotransferase (APT) family kinase protein
MSAPAVPGTLADREFVQAWFAARLERLHPGASSVTVQQVERISRGVSRQTWTVQATVDGRPEAFIVRRDHEAGSVIPTALRLEYEVYRRLVDAPVPTSAALWFEDDPAWMPDGRIAYVRQEVAGHWYLPFIADESEAADEQRIAASKEHLDKLAALHTADWAALGFGEIFDVPAGPEDCARSLIETQLKSLAEFQFESNPALAEGIAQLIERAPRDAPRISLCKGTNGHGEEVWRDGRIVAMSDWELSYLTDPAYDFALVQEMIPEIVRDGRRVWGRPEALEYYRERSGIAVTHERIEYYRAVYGVMQFLYTHHSGHLIRNRGFRDLRFLWTAWENSYRSNIRLGQEFGFAPEGVRIR